MQNKRIILYVGIVCVLSVVLMIVALTFDGGMKAGEFTPPAFDSSAQGGVPNVPKELGYSQVDTSAYAFSMCGKLLNQNGSVAVYLTNPADSDVWLKLRIYDTNGKMIAESGLICQGEFVMSVALLDENYAGDATIKIMAYEPETYYSAGAVALNTQIEK